MTGNMPWKFLSDNAVRNGKQDKFGVHSAYARVLFHIATTCETPFTIALYSNWGTGKTSICNLVEELAGSKNDVHYVYLDVWKYSSEPLKRWVLLESERSLNAQGAIKGFQFDGRTLQSHLEFEESWEDRGKISVSFRALRWLASSTVACIVIFIACLLLPESAPRFWKIMGPFWGVLAAGGVTTLLFENVVKELFKSLSGLILERKVRHVAAQPAFSSEKFAQLFRSLVTQATSSTEPEKKRIIFVFDNLDRCTEAVAVETIGVIKTFLDEAGCVYIIPCDETALMKHITKSYTSEDGKDGARKYAKEFLNKFFQTTLRLPVAPEFDIETFLDEQLQLAGMTDLPADARDVLVLGYLGQTPRQIKRVLNDLTAYRSLAVQAEKENLVEQGALTSDLSLLTKMSVISVEWPNFLNMLADDPELWADLMDKISRGQIIETEGVQPDLASFLHATRHVSPEADIRPFVYLKRVKYERNVAVATAVQNSLRKGEAAPFLELLNSAKSENDREEIIRAATDISRKWLEAGRDVFLKNASSVLLKAANNVPGNRPLELTVSNLLEHLSRSKPSELAEAVELPDLFAFTPSVQTGQKEQCLEKLTDVFDPSTQVTKNLFIYWKQLIEHQDQLGDPIRLKLRDFIERRYGSSEADALQFLYDASQEKNSSTDWVAQGSVLLAVAQKTNLSGDDTDKQRVAVIVRFQHLMDSIAKQSVASIIAAALNGNRTRAVDAQAKSAVDLLTRLDPAVLGSDNLQLISPVLIEQVNAHSSFAEKASWLAPLIAIRKGLSPSAQAQVDGLYQPLLSDPGDPNAIANLLSGMGGPTCSLLLEEQKNVQAMHDQAAHLEGRHGIGPAPGLRERILNSFPAATILNKLEVFDESRSWDLALFPKNLIRGGQSKLPIELSRKQTMAFTERFLRGRTSNHPAVLDGLIDANRNISELLDEPIARSLASCTIEVVGTNVEKYFGDLRFLSTKLSGPSRIWLVRELVDAVLKPRQSQWIQVLQKITEDLDKDEAISNEEALVSELNDYAFEAARLSPNEASATLLLLSNRLSPEARAQNTDEALDRLLGLEGSGATIDQMRPYLPLILATGPDLRTSAREKLEKYCERMLGPAKPDGEKIAVINFLADPGSKLLTPKLQSRLSELAEGEDSVAETARKIIGEADPKPDTAQ
jgi:KAP family P-loop domain